MVQQLLPLTFGLDVVRRSVDQLAAKQEQLTQNIAVLQATVEEDVRQKVSSTPPPPTLQAASIREQPKARPRTMQPSSMRDR
jgi:cell division septum initiation protein DivIVA